MRRSNKPEEADEVNVSQPLPQSFIIKVWIEETVTEAGRVTWRGYITHVDTRHPSKNPYDKRHTVNDFDDIRDFVMPYLEEMGVKVGGQNNLRRWLTQAKLRLHRSFKRRND